MKLHQDKAGPCRVPHRAWHGHLALFLFGGTANPWGALKNLCLQQSRDGLWCLPKHPGAKEPGHKDAGSSPSGPKRHNQNVKLLLQMCPGSCELSPTRVPLSSQCRRSAETFLKHSDLHLATFIFLIDSNFQSAMDYFSKTKQNQLFS